jgi:RNA polymerase sigma factor for flagellar operon FliA
VSEQNAQTSYLRSQVESDTSGKRKDRSKERPRPVPASEIPDLSTAELVDRYEPLVHRIAHDIHQAQQSMNVALEDIQHYGYEGLLQAQQRFDPSAGSAFSTYAYYRIRGSILDAFRSEGWALRNQSFEVLDHIALNEHMESHSRASSQLPSSKTWRDSVQHLQKMVGDSVTILMMRNIDLQNMRTTDADTRTADFETYENLQALRRAIDGLSDNEREVIIRYHYEGESMQTIGETLGYSKSWVSRCNARAISKIRKQLVDD